MINKSIILLIITLLPASVLLAQAQRSMLSVSPAVAIPHGEFRQAVNSDSNVLGLGFNSNLLFNPKGSKAYSPVWFGVDYSYITFGRDKQASSGNLPPYKTTYNYHIINGIARLFLTDKTEGFTPFVDGMLGLKIYNTRTKVDKNLWNVILNDDQPEVIHTTNDTGMDYSVGVGFYNRKITDGESKTSFTLRIAYTWGDKIQYIKRGSLKVTNDTITFETDYANTSMILVQLGINIFD